MITTPGFYDIPMAEYLADPCPEPALSSGIVAELFSGTPQRAKMIHPRLTPSALDTSPRADKGSAVHALAHGGYPIKYVERVAKRSGKEAGIEFEPQDWLTQDAKDAAAAIRKEGGIPLLPKDRLGIETAAASVTAALAQLGTGTHERTMIFQFEGVWCRARADWLSDGAVMKPDLDMEAPDGVDGDTKTCDRADAVTWIKTTLPNSNNLEQLALRHLGHIALTGKPRKMIWLLQEYEAPFDSCFVGATDEMIEIGVRRVRHAAKLWRRCLDEQRWPGNPRRVTWAVPPTWMAWEMENRGIA